MSMKNESSNIHSIFPALQLGHSEGVSFRILEHLKLFIEIEVKEKLKIHFPRVS